MKKKNNTRIEAPNGSCKDSGRLLRSNRYIHRCIQLRNHFRRRRLFTETYGDRGDFSQPKKTVSSSFHSSSVNMSGVLAAESIASCCGCSVGYCRCQVKTPVHDPHRHLKLRITDPIDRCECPPGFCRCEESVGSCFSPTSLELRGAVAISNGDGSCGCFPGYSRCEAKTPVHDPYRFLKLRTSDPIDLCECPPGFCRCCEESVGSCFSSTYMGLNGRVSINNEGGSSCGCSPGYCRCEAKTPVHNPYRFFKLRTSDHIDRCCECLPGFCCCCQESVSSWFSSTSMGLSGGVAISNEGDSCGCPPGYCRCEAKTPVHDPHRSFKLRTSDPIDGYCECPPGFCRCEALSSPPTWMQFQ